MVGFFFILKYFEYYLIYFMAVNHLREKEQIRRFLIAMLIVCFCVCVYAISQIPYVERVSAPFEGEIGEPNTLGGYLVLMLSLVVSLLVTPKAIGKKPLLLVLLGLMLVSLAATLSRGSWLALPPVLLVLIALSRNRLLIVIPLVIALAFSPYLLPKSVTDRVGYTFNQPENEEQLKIGTVKVDSSTSARLISWKVILTQDFVHHPIIGWGVTGHSFVDAQIPRILIETGLLGLTAFFVLIGLLVPARPARAPREPGAPLRGDRHRLHRRDRGASRPQHRRQHLHPRADHGALLVPDGPDHHDPEVRKRGNPRGSGGRPLAPA